MGSGNRNDGRQAITPHPFTRLGVAAVALDSDPAAGTATTEPGVAGTSTIEPGQRVGQYEVIREIGRGGMGRVMLARDTRLGRRVAMKFLATQSAELTARFLVEARTTALVNHDNIVVIHEIDEHAGAPYMVLEYLEGVPLRKLLDHTPMPAGRAVEIAVPIVRALVRAHDAGIVHRDLKPENVFVTEGGSIKVLDFGIAKLLASEMPTQLRFSGPITERDLADEPDTTSPGGLVGTLPYMSPEQLGIDEIDHRTDLWAVGIMIFEMVAGSHPLALESAASLIAEVADMTTPMPAVGTHAPGLLDGLARIVDRCLAKSKLARYATARELLADLEALLPGRYRRQLADHDSPYPGLIAFQEGDADRFYGRDHDVARMVARVRDRPLVGVVGPSGVGKSSFVRAGVVPALKSSGEAWDVHVLRPGRQPLASLATVLRADGGAAGQLVDRLRREPGYLGAQLRARAAQTGGRIMLFVDQFEELYTHVPEAAERFAYLACLSGAADDAASPIRVVVSMRSDFLDRAGEHPRFLDELTGGLVFLQPLGRDALRDALVRPLESRGYRFETQDMIDDMLAPLQATPGALPLLQFSAAHLWETRDRARKLLTRASYDAMGGISGALATHADRVLATLAPDGQQRARAIFVRLVTPERTRAVVDLRELAGLGPDARAVEGVVDHLIAARLLVAQSLGEAAGSSIELVHESLIASWPTLRRWLDEGHEDAVQLTQLRAAAGQWDRRGRVDGLLWSGEALVDARRWHARYAGELPERERTFLAAAFGLATRAARVRRAIVIGIIVLLSAAVAGGAIALLAIRDAEQTAIEQAREAGKASQRAQAETVKAQASDAKTRKALDDLTAETKAKDDAERDAHDKGAQVALTRAQLEQALATAKLERSNAEAEATKARAAAAEAKRAQDEANRLYVSEKARREAAEHQRAKITTELSK